MPNPENLSKTGRPPVFDEVTALKVLRARRLSGEGTTVAQFIENEVGDTLPHRVSRTAINRLFTGEMFPDLIDPDTGQRFDYMSLPCVRPGRPKREKDERGELIPSGAKRRTLTPLRLQLIAAVQEDLHRTIAAKVAAQFMLADQKLQQELVDVRRRLQVVEDKLAGLANRAR